jgi:hypothetical protein
MLFITLYDRFIDPSVRSAGMHDMDPATLSEAVEDPVTLNEAAVSEAWRQMWRSKCARHGPNNSRGGVEVDMEESECAAWI